MTDNVPVWLFSFVDLAFLLIIAMTQIGVDSNGISLELGEILIPRIESEATQNLPGGSAERWQLRVHPMNEALQQPFELTRPERGSAMPTSCAAASRTCTPRAPQSPSWRRTKIPEARTCSTQ